MTAPGRRKLAEFRPQARNANRHTARGLRHLDASISEDGYVSPMTAAANGDVFIGSARLETSAEKFGTDVEPIVVEHDGTRPIIAIRTDIPSADDPRAVRMAIRDNRIAELDLDWDPFIVATIAAEDSEMLRRVFDDDDALAKLLHEAESIDLGEDPDGDGGTSKDDAQDGAICTCPKCGFRFQMLK